MLDLEPIKWRLEMSSRLPMFNYAGRATEDVRQLIAEVERLREEVVPSMPEITPEERFEEWQANG